MSDHIVTRESLISMLQNSNPEFVNRVIGRALVGLFERQTESEKNSTATLEHNQIGFAGADARQGTITAKYFIKHQDLLDWQRDIWTRPNKNGIPRLAKYWRQLDEIAKVKAARKQPETV